MATSGSYYINGPSLGSSTAVFLDAALTTLAPDGFYADGIISREQVDGALLPQQDCDCGGIPISYNCIEGDCVDPSDGTGTYATLADCLLACGTPLLAVTNVGSGTHNELGEYYADASVTLNGPVAVDTLFYVNVTTSIAGVIAVAVTIYAGFDYGSGSQYAGMGDIGGSLGACIASCDNPSVDLTGFTC